MDVPRLLTACPPNTATAALIFVSMVICSPPCSANANESTNKDKARLALAFLPGSNIFYRTFQLFYCETNGREFDLCHGWKTNIEFFLSQK